MFVVRGSFSIKSILLKYPRVMVGIVRSGTPSVDVIMLGNGGTVGKVPKLSFGSKDSNNVVIN